MKTPFLLLSVFFLLSGTPAAAGIDLATVPPPREVQLTIYQPADLCLVREIRDQPFRKGMNRFQITWTGGLLDPTSIELEPLEKTEDIRLNGLFFPPRTRDRAVWLIESRKEGRLPMALTYLTSGFEWEAVYTATLEEDGGSARLDSNVKITNRSGKDHGPAQFRLLAGKIRLTDPVAELAAREHPYGRPGMLLEPGFPESAADSIAMKRSLMTLAEGAPSPPEVPVETVSDFFLFTIEGLRSIPDITAKTLPLMDPVHMPVTDLYRYDESRFGTRPVRFLTFVNRDIHPSGTAPLPPGNVTVYRKTGPGSRLSYEGYGPIPYIPAGETVELALGHSGDVSLEARLMKESSNGYSFDGQGEISGWNEVRHWELEMFNPGKIPARMQVYRHASTPRWRIEHDTEEGEFEKKDRNTFRFQLTLEPAERRTINYRITTRHGDSIEGRN